MRNLYYLLAFQEICNDGSDCGCERIRARRTPSSFLKVATLSHFTPQHLHTYKTKKNELRSFIIPKF